MKKGSEYKPNQSFGLLLTGEPKSGKTTLAMAFPNPYFADADNNLSSAVRQFPNKNFMFDTFDVQDDGSPRPENLRWSAMTKGLKEAAASNEVETIVLDSLTKVSDYCVAHVLAQEHQTQMRIQDWGKFRLLLQQLIVWLRSTGKLIIVIAHEKWVRDEGTGILMRQVNVPSALGNTIGALFSDVWRCETELKDNNVQYYVRTAPTNRLALGNSLGLPPKFKFSWEDFQKYLNNEKQQN